MDNKFNKVFSFFFLLNSEFLPGNRLIDIFPNHFYFYLIDRSNNQNIKSYIKRLNNITIQVLLDSYSVVVVSDTSVKNQVACYELKSLELDKRTNSCIRVNTRELNKELFTK